MRPRTRATVADESECRHGRAPFPWHCAPFPLACHYGSLEELMALTRPEVALPRAALSVISNRRQESYAFYFQAKPPLSGTRPESLLRPVREFSRLVSAMCIKARPRGLLATQVRASGPSCGKGRYDTRCELVAAEASPPWPRGRSSMVEPQPSKLVMRVRFPSPAPNQKPQVRVGSAVEADRDQDTRPFRRARCVPDRLFGRSLTPSWHRQGHRRRIRRDSQISWRTTFARISRRRTPSLWLALPNLPFHRSRRRLRRRGPPSPPRSALGGPRGARRAMPQAA